VTWTACSAADSARRARRAELLPQRHGDTARADHEHDVGSGANLDQYTSGISQISIGSYGDPLLASPPANRGIAPRRRGTSRRR
jgi:hypothetical protein